VLEGIFTVFREMRSGTYDEQELEAQLLRYMSCCHKELLATYMQLG
jgi:hypothetical protein